MALRPFAALGLAAFVFSSLMMTACGGPVDTTPLTGASPTPLPTASPTPTATATPVALSLAPATLAFNAGTGNVLTVAVTDGTAGPYSTSGCSGITTTSVSGTTVTVTAVAAGSCTLTVSDPAANQATVAVTVTTVSIPVQ